ncbi:hypothetical protein [Reinekea marinisedimentorum]|uniref:Uncharacterized protein n=1 Tax=Reinekea marinisedimentorum TaxID=230495 RepID=A0A4R3I575_9GAMM|nr:hypothetical protein [Reinekea marinisedimentorum]TCS40412.1 hypothetical protein BCF53_109122 [Reinekea marinisedimentorum]
MNVEKEPNLTQVIESIVSAAKGTPTFPTDTKGFRLLEAMVRICKEKEPEHSELTINFIDLADHLNLKGDKEELTREVRRLHKYISGKLINYRPALENRLHKANHREFIELVKVDGASKLILKKIPLKAQQSSVASESTVDLIQYEPTIEKTPFGELNFNITKRSGLILLTAFVAFFVCSYFSWLWVWLSDASWFFKTVATAGIPYFWYSVISPIFKALDGATLAPFWLRPSLTDSLLLVDKDQKQGCFKLTLKSYQATCPICGSSVRIKEGKNNMKGRLVGQCLATSEHLYTFDHVKERGVPAHTPMYLPK